MSHISPDDVGARVTVRRRVDGALSDAVGDLEQADGETLAVRVSAGSLVTVPVSEVVAARVIGASPREAVELEGVAARGWPAPDSEWLGQWWLRAADGFTARANAVRPLGGPDRTLDSALARVGDWYRDRGLPPRVQVVVGSSLDRELSRRGWTAAPEVSVMTATLARVANRLTGPDDASVRLDDVASSEWLRLFRGGDAPPVARAILEAPAVVGFATRTDDENTPVAIGRAVVEGPWVGFSAIEVAPDSRRRGHGRAVIGQLTSWGRARGAMRAYLEVLATNEPAIALYRSLGFAEHHRYACREAP
ncbi:MAG TPA: GNAT family N-acetyltransferase [Acidothermaceae bacterium]|nr:GNAT family N-acetyltransferase [Acidothermaceae bacterium]